MSFALKVAGTGKVALVCKSSLDEANTDLAQGGVASVTNLEIDNFEKHIHDTMVAGEKAISTFTVRVATASSVYCIMPTILAMKFRNRSLRL